MGLLKKIGKVVKGVGKVVKGVVKGVGKVFKKVIGAVGKVLGSKLGKLVMFAIAIYTGGMALAAGFNSFMTSTAPSFLGKFVAGAKGFVGALTGKGVAEKGVEGAVVAGGEGAAGSQMGGMLGAGSSAPAVETVSTAAEAAGKVANVANTAANATDAVDKVSTLGKVVDAGRKVGGGLLDFAKSEGGSTIISQALQGRAAAEELEQKQKNFEMLSGPMNADEYNKLLEQSQNMTTPEGFLQRARNVDRGLTRQRYPEASGDPEQVYGDYVTGAAPAGG